jgi:hypothetical protein
MQSRFAIVTALVVTGAGLASNAAADEVVFQAGFTNGFFTPFTTATAATRKIGDGGWLTGLSSVPVDGINRITLGLATWDAAGAGVSAGVADIKFTFNDGDPSGLVFGPGTPLYSTTIQDVVLPATAGTDPTYFDLSIPLPGLSTSGGFNNIGWSIAVENFDFDGNFGVQTAATPNAVGFFTNVASEFAGPLNPTGWATFSFGNPANFRAIVTVPEPTTLATLAVAALLAGRRRR